MCDRISALISLTLGTETLLQPRHCSRFSCPSAIRPPPRRLTAPGVRGNLLTHFTFDRQNSGHLNGSLNGSPVQGVLEREVPVQSSGLSQRPERKDFPFREARCRCGGPGSVLNGGCSFSGGCQRPRDAPSSRPSPAPRRSGMDARQRGSHARICGCVPQRLEPRRRGWPSSCPAAAAESSENSWCKCPKARYARARLPTTRSATRPQKHPKQCSSLTHKGRHAPVTVAHRRGVTPRLQLRRMRRRSPPTPRRVRLYAPPASCRRPRRL